MTGKRHNGELKPRFRCRPQYSTTADRCTLVHVVKRAVELSCMGAVRMSKFSSIICLIDCRSCAVRQGATSEACCCVALKSDTAASRQNVGTLHVVRAATHSLVYAAVHALSRPVRDV
jgi:hypothetical protein